MICYVICLIIITISIYIIYFCAVPAYFMYEMTINKIDNKREQLAFMSKIYMAYTYGVT